ncbi:hypothetical protein FA13DRAFT_1779922 [Coprinellus micaceus]|uniref:Uncharacterized protein n=1 Tax=Coprinellus micaceus TaxID=71717 RepID=A0A4Y7SF03_COPMI|nr:hypothetical protein FA13DRAFT_1779922 [Coprinellus micaceus]
MRGKNFGGFSRAVPEKNTKRKVVDFDCPRLYVESNSKLGGDGFALVDTTELGVDTKVFLLMKSLTLEHSGPLRRCSGLGRKDTRRSTEQNEYQGIRPAPTRIAYVCADTFMPTRRWFENLRDLRHACGTSPRPQVAPDAGTCGSCGVPAEARTWLLRGLGASKST